MDDSKKEEATPPEASVNHIDEARVKRMKTRGHMMTMLEEFEVLRLKFFYDKLTDKQEATRFVTLVKYFMENGPTEPMRLSCRLLYEKYIEKQNL